ncbi:hypothetical protein GCM10023194_36120 [Planotetraspora phitsanulokensis]|uniref:Uncharacterized protein n=1 Tax=Planotetraspora phitsanulokensis TaxID=575192 RepID=A0A8J3XCQ4_9ACTN|nr:hypothetical protein [Planotetraspora phitsanulokensis]GII36260.1 hypothetical protein Pph01_12630 [Planotetraspora phitsanulokensis]
MHRGEWRTLPPLQRALGPHPLADSGDAFSGTLTTWRNPSSLAPLGHHVVDGPGGLVGPFSPGTAPATERPGTPDDDRPPVRHAPGHEPVTIARWAAPMPSLDALPVVSRDHEAEPRAEMRDDVPADGSRGYAPDDPGRSWSGVLPPGAHADGVPDAHAWDGPEQVHAVDAGSARGTRPLSGDTTMSTSVTETAQRLSPETAIGQAPASPAPPAGHPGSAVQRTAVRRLGLGPPIETGSPGGAAPWNARADTLTGSPPGSRQASGQASGQAGRSGTTPTVARIEVHGAQNPDPGFARSAPHDSAEQPAGARGQAEATPVAPTLGWDQPGMTVSTPVSPGDSGRTSTGTPPGRSGVTAARGIGEPVQRTPTGTPAADGLPRAAVDRPHADHPHADHPHADHPHADHPDAARPDAARLDVVARAVLPESITTRPLLGSRGIEATQAVSVPLVDAGADLSPGAGEPPLPRTGGAEPLAALQRSAAPAVPAVPMRPAAREASSPVGYAPTLTAASGSDTAPAVQAVHTPAVSAADSQAESGTAPPYGKAEMARQVVMRLAAAGVPVAREEDPVAEEVVRAPAQDAPAAGAVPAGRAPGDAKQDQELVGRLLEPLLRRLRAELWLERERRGDLSEPGGRRF